MSTPKFAWDKVVLFLVSLFLSLVFWLQVQAQADQATEQRLSVVLQPLNTPEGLIPENLPPAVDVVARGPQSTLRTIPREEWRATVDLAQAKAGEARFEIRLRGPRDDNYEMNLVSQGVRVKLSPVKRISKPVEVDPTGNSPEGTVYQGAEVQPGRVTLVGTENSMIKVARVRVLLDRARLTSFQMIELPVDVLDANGQRIDNISTDPPSVTVRPQFLREETTASVLIRPRFVGTLPFGYEVESFQIDPVQVDLKGKSNILSGIQRVDTTPVDLSGLKATKTVEADLVIPPGVALEREQKVRVTLNIRRGAAGGGN